MIDDTKTMGQIAYEAFHDTYAPKSVGPLAWSEIAETKRAAWEAAASAVLSQPHRGTIHGPVEMRDYDYATLARPHILFLSAEGLARGQGIEVPEGARLYMVKPETGAAGLSWEVGTATPLGGSRFDGPEAQARMADLVAKAKALRDSEGNAITDEMVEVESAKLDALNETLAVIENAERIEKDDGGEDPREVGYP